MALFIGDIQMGLEDDRHLGFGYAESLQLDASVRASLDLAVVAVANDIELDSDDLFMWLNSKHGRWLCDRVQSGAEPTEATVRKELNAEVMLALVEEDESIHAEGR